MAIRTSTANSLRLLDETKQEYLAECFRSIQQAKSMIKIVNKIALRRTDLSELCADIIEQENEIIQTELERIKAESNVKN